VKLFQDKNNSEGERRSGKFGGHFLYKEEANPDGGFGARWGLVEDVFF
jgi:hypothetical protein